MLERTHEPFSPRIRYPHGTHPLPQSEKHTYRTRFIARNRKNRLKSCRGRGEKRRKSKRRRRRGIELKEQIGQKGERVR